VARPDKGVVNKLHASIPSKVFFTPCQGVPPKVNSPTVFQQHPLSQLVLARIREFHREPEIVFWVYGFPALMVIALGLAFRDRPVEAVSVDIQAGPHAAIAEKALANNDRFKAETLPEAEARRHLRTGKVDLVVVVKSVSPPTIEYVYDVARPEGVLARSTVDDAIERSLGRKDLAQTADAHVKEPGARYIDFLVPGLLGMSIMGGGLWGVGFVIVDMRVRKVLKRLLATPMRRTDFLGAIMISRLVLLIPEVLVLLAISWLLFGVTVFGSLGTLLLLIVIGAGAFAGLGLLVASRAKTIEAVSGLMNLVMLPMWLTSGIFFSSERFPELMQPIIRALPLTLLIDALRSVMLEGASLSSQLLRIGALIAWGAVSFVIALRYFRWV
jgi:ABC-2 type transport system permease protein